MKLKKSLLVILTAMLIISLATYAASAFGSIGWDGASGLTQMLNPHAKSWGELPELDPESWELLLVNSANLLPTDFYVERGITAGGYEFDARAVDALDSMISAGMQAGMQLVLTSAYRSHDYQTQLYENKIWRVMEERDCSYEEAADIAATEVARPGTSEHQAGLAADIVCADYSILDRGYADTDEAKWLRENCADYGFILRYDEDKQDITGIIYEPWHFRYVGIEAAEYIMENGLCLEEFLELY